MCLSLPSVLLLSSTWAQGGCSGTPGGSGVRVSLWGASMRGLLSPVLLSVSPSLGACSVSQAVNSRKLPGRHMEGVGWGRHEP